MSFPGRMPDSIASAKYAPPTTVIPQTLAKPSAEKVAEIRDFVQSLEHAPPARSSKGVRGFVIFVVSRMGMVPLFVFIILPRKLGDMAGPMASMVGKQIMALSAQMSAFMAKTATQLQAIAKPLNQILGGLNKGLGSAFSAASELIHAVQATFKHLTAVARAPFEKTTKFFESIRSDFMQRFTQLKSAFAALMTRVFSREAQTANPSFINLSKMFNRLSEGLKRMTKEGVRFVETRLKRAKELIEKPLKILSEALTREVQKMTAQVAHQIEATFTPVINLVLSASLFAKQWGEGKLSNFAQVITAFSKQASSIVQTIAHNMSRWMDQKILQRIILPLMGSLKAGLSKVAEFQQRLFQISKTRTEEMFRRFQADLKRLTKKIENVFGSIQGWAKRKWKQKILPRLKEVPKLAKQSSQALIRISISLWFWLLKALKYLAQFIRQFGRLMKDMLKEALREVAAQAKQ